MSHTQKIAIEGILIGLVALLALWAVLLFRQTEEDGRSLTPREWVEIREEEQRIIESQMAETLTRAEVEERKELLKAAETMHENTPPMTESERYILMEQSREAFRQ